MGLSAPIPPRILRVRYRSNHHPRRKAEVWVKVPYGGIHSMYALVDTLTRAMQQREILSFSVDAPSKGIGEHRAQLARWRDALPTTSERTDVRWD